MSNTEMTAKIETIKAAIAARCANVIADIESRKAKTVQFLFHFKRLQNEELIAGLVEKFDFIDADFFAFVDQFKSKYDSRAQREYLAVYAIEKAIDMLYCCAGMSKKVDNYTRAIVTNARAFPDKAIDYDLCTASLTHAVNVHDAETLKTRLHKADTTASTQKSSTKSALIALRAGSYDATSRRLSLDTKSALFRALVKQAF